jgi:hypothetical protein
MSYHIGRLLELHHHEVSSNYRSSGIVSQDVSVAILFQEWFAGIISKAYSLKLTFTDINAKLT